MDLTHLKPKDFTVSVAKWFKDNQGLVEIKFKNEKYAQGKRLNYLDKSILMTDEIFDSMMNSIDVYIKTISTFYFENIGARVNELGSRKNDTKEKVFEFEFYSILFSLLDVIDAFEKGRRKALAECDYSELLSKLKDGYKTLKHNIGYLKEG